MVIDDLDHDSIWCDHSVQDILDQKHKDYKSAEIGILTLRETLKSNLCPAEVNLSSFYF